MMLGFTVEEKFSASELKTITLITILLTEEPGDLKTVIVKAYANNKVTKKIIHVLASGDRNISFK
jgi:ribosomal protein L25 (general stress protein Ctc)